MDDLSTGNGQNIRHHLDRDTVRLVTGSVLDAPLVRELVAGADAVIHLAATVGVELVVRDGPSRSTWREPAPSWPRAARTGPGSC